MRSLRPEAPEKLLERVALRIVELRHAAGMTQESFAEALDVSVQWVSRVETGENLTLTTMARIAAALGARVNDLFEPPTPVPRSKRGRPRKKSGR